MNPFIPPLLCSNTMNLDAVKDYKVLVIGDWIIDEYRYVRTIGKAIKENTMSVQLEDAESFQGGVWAGAAHLKDFCRQVDVMCGESIMHNIKYVESTYKHKLFSVHRKEPYFEVAEYDIPSYDVVIMADFGHGAITPKLIDRVTKEAKYLAVNAQTNSTNYGFNMITKFPRADFVVVDELEARLAAHDKEGDIEDVILKLGFNNIVVTLGKNGAVGYDGAFYRADAAAGVIVDTMGAGDAFLCISSVYARAQFAMADILRLGNAAGAVKVGIVGHQKAVTKAVLETYL